LVLIIQLEDLLSTLYSLSNLASLHINISITIVEVLIYFLNSYKQPHLTTASWLRKIASWSFIVEERRQMGSHFLSFPAGLLLNTTMSKEGMNVYFLTIELFVICPGTTKVAQKLGWKKIPLPGVKRLSLISGLNW